MCIAIVRCGDARIARFHALEIAAHCPLDSYVTPALIDDAIPAFPAAAPWMGTVHHNRIAQLATGDGSIKKLEVAEFIAALAGSSVEQDACSRRNIMFPAKLVARDSRGLAVEIELRSAKADHSLRCHTQILHCMIACLRPPYQQPVGLSGNGPLGAWVIPGIHDQDKRNPASARSGDKVIYEYPREYSWMNQNVRRFPFEEGVQVTIGKALDATARPSSKCMK